MPLKGLANVKKAMNVDIYERANENIKGVYLAGLGDIVGATPVGLTASELVYNTSTSGTTKNNWFLSVGAASTKTTESKSKMGLGSLSQLRKMPMRVLNRKLFFTNNKPNIVTLEYGGYPVPVKKGSLTKKGFVKLSQDGFSLQATGGWVRSTLILMANKIRSL